MVKFDPAGFAAMMARIEEEERVRERQQFTLRSPYEDLEPDHEYMPTAGVEGLGPFAG